jgi:hypothetical protein
MTSEDDSDHVRTATAPLGTADSRAGEVQAASGGAWLFAPGHELAGRYVIRAFIARGGMGEVYEAFDTHSGGAVALKALLPAGDPARREERLKREVVLARKVTHPNVCRVHDVGHESVSGAVGVTVPFVTMELLYGETLAAYLARSGPIPLEQVTPIVEQLVAGLDAAHAAGIVHRDFKPHNVILVREGTDRRAVITDFGLARAMSTEHGNVITTDFAGTPAFMAPEQVLDQPVTPATDVYALGLTLFEMVTGRRPFDAESPFANAMKRVQTDAPRASTFVRELDARWDAAIARCLARDPAHRFARAGELLTALRADVPVVVMSSPPRWTESYRRGARWLVVATAAVAVAAAALVVMRGSGRGATAPGVVRHDDGNVPVVVTLGSTREAEVRDIASASGDDLVVAGASVTSFGLGGRSGRTVDGRWAGFVGRVTADGRARWLRTVVGTHDTWVNAIAIDDDAVVIVGTRMGAIDLERGVRVERPDAVHGCFLAALDADDGVARWLRDCGTRSALGSSVVVTNDVIYMVASDAESTLSDGGSRSGFAVSAWDRDGGMRWTRTFPSEGWFTGARLALDGDTLVVAGSLAGSARVGAETRISRGRSDVLIVSLDLANGDERWSVILGGDDADFLGDIAVLPDGRLAVAGSHHGEIALVDGQPRRSRGGSDVFVALLDPAGTVEHAWYGGSVGVDVLTSIAVTGDRIAVAGEVDPGFVGDRTPALASHAAIVLDLARDGTAINLASFGVLDATQPMSLTSTAGGAVAIGGQFRYRLEAGAHAVTAAAMDGFVLILRPSRPTP